MDKHDFLAYSARMGLHRLLHRVKLQTEHGGIVKTGHAVHQFPYMQVYLDRRQEPVGI